MMAMLDDGAYSPWIPNDNPFTNSVSGKVNAVYSYGHRNAQGLVWANVGAQYILYNSEHGDKSDDEVNIISAGRNYGWPKVAGMCDDNYTTPMQIRIMINSPTRSSQMKKLFVSQTM